MKHWLKKDRTGEQESQHSESSGHSLQVFNYNDFLDRVMGDKELAMSILEEFTELIGQHAEKLRQAVESGDHETVRQIGHMIKGESGNISAPALYESAYAMEKSGKTQDRAEQQALLPTLLENIETLKKVIRETVQKRSR
ncbi:Hpt domain-containing protein [Prosthecochloris sp. SCSIO W1101]|uniref:Hpt domain-containing protein n=1 Tax=Prosthecochloris sp. SCSIO W1101 TaxID=2992242 RepID=UPI00223D3C7E|nr:Hpt domain-containing protein [Prosthecochloris sp. SCSIO W1101]UZJ42086.1 Hpt domain-containing protein [Prosthecochloris sp. SCSIO W1101]